MWIRFVWFRIEYNIVLLLIHEIVDYLKAYTILKDFTLWSQEIGTLFFVLERQIARSFCSDIPLLLAVVYLNVSLSLDREKLGILRFLYSAGPVNETWYT
jgi:hypothetical protein